MWGDQIQIHEVGVFTHIASIQEYQEAKMTVYTWDSVTRPSMNGYPVYTGQSKHHLGPAYLYLWDWGLGQGVNWFLSDNVTSDYRGVESPDLEFVQERCPEQVNPRGSPWSVYTR